MSIFEFGSVLSGVAVTVSLATLLVAAGMPLSLLVDLWRAQRARRRESLVGQ